MSTGSLSSFKIDERMSATLQELKDSTGAATKAEVLRRAVALLEVAQKAAKSGSQLQLVDLDDEGQEINKRQIILP